MTVTLAPVQSSNIESVGFDPDAGEIHVKFKNGQSFAYGGCVQADHDTLVKAPSIGSHFHSAIRSKKKGRKL